MVKKGSSYIHYEFKSVERLIGEGKIRNEFIGDMIYSENGNSFVWIFQKSELSGNNLEGVKNTIKNWLANPSGLAKLNKIKDFPGNKEKFIEIFNLGGDVDITAANVLKYLDDNLDNIFFAK